MHLAVVERLRCPVGHAESPLVAAASRQVERRIVQGVLGCPVCGASYPISAGIADFRATESTASASQEREPPNEDATMRLAAQLDLTEPGRLVLLFGDYARLAPALSVMFDALCVAVNPAPNAERHVAEHASVLRVADVLPLARESMHGVAVDVAHSVEAARALLRQQGRLVAHGPLPIPAGVELLARDEREWVGARGVEAVQLRRAAR